MRAEGEFGLEMLPVGSALCGIAEAHYLRPGTPAPHSGSKWGLTLGIYPAHEALKSLVLMRITDGTHTGLWARCSRLRNQPDVLPGLCCEAVPPPYRAGCSILPSRSGREIHAALWFQRLIP